MAPDEVMVYTGVAIVPIVAATAGAAALWAASRRAISVAVGCVAFLVAVPVAMVLSFLFVNAFSHLLHGDGALAIVAAPVMGAILTIPVVLAFIVAVIVIARRRRT